jgi:hypothetical protein
VSSEKVYQIEVALDYSEPPIWRRIQVSGDTTLAQLHRILQAVMGWQDYHLHQFIVGETYYSVPHPAYDDFREMSDEREARLSQVAPNEGDAFQYEYDFGDSWLHTLVVEKLMPPEPGREYPLCLQGERATPPEDVGGVPGYEFFLEAIQDPDHPEHEDYLEWIGGAFDPEAFDVGEVNVALEGL